MGTQPESRASDGWCCASGACWPSARSLLPPTPNPAAADGGRQGFGFNKLLHPPAALQSGQSEMPLKLQGHLLFGRGSRSVQRIGRVQPVVEVGRVFPVAEVGFGGPCCAGSGQPAARSGPRPQLSREEGCMLARAVLAGSGQPTGGSCSSGSVRAKRGSALELGD
jgi:hypothetical protein